MKTKANNPKNAPDQVTVSGMETFRLTLFLLFHKGITPAIRFWNNRKHYRRYAEKAMNTPNLRDNNLVHTGAWGVSVPHNFYFGRYPIPLTVFNPILRLLRDLSVVFNPKRTNPDYITVIKGMEILSSGWFIKEKQKERSKRLRELGYRNLYPFALDLFPVFLVTMFRTDEERSYITIRREMGLILTLWINSVRKEKGFGGPFSLYLSRLLDKWNSTGNDQARRVISEYIRATNDTRKANPLNSRIDNELLPPSIQFLSSINTPKLIREDAYKKKFYGLTCKGEMYKVILKDTEHDINQYPQKYSRFKGDVVAAASLIFIMMNNIEPSLQNGVDAEFQLVPLSVQFAQRKRGADPTDPERYLSFGPTQMMNGDAEKMIPFMHQRAGMLIVGTAQANNQKSKDQ